jgi:hypothetical protein
MAFRAVPSHPFLLPSVLGSGPWFSLTAVLLLVLSGCGPVRYGLEIATAERVVAAARTENASYYAPYELYFAEAHLAKAHEEAAEGQYEDAINALTVAVAYGRRALTRSAQPGAFR